MRLTNEEQKLLDGDGGAAAAMAMRIIVDMGRIMGADKLIPITSAHIDGCFTARPKGATMMPQRRRLRVPTLGAALAKD